MLRVTCGIHIAREILSAGAPANMSPISLSAERQRRSMSQAASVSASYTAETDDAG